MGESIEQPARESVAELESPAARWLERVAFVIGSIGLLGAMAADSLAVLGRHLGLPILGSIEIVQACVVLLASASMLGATLRATHARVHILIDRLHGSGKHLLLRCSNLLSSIVFLLFAIGSIWIARELWGGHEHSELLHIPLRWLRALWIVTALTIAAVFLTRIVRRGR